MSAHPRQLALPQSGAIVGPKEAANVPARTLGGKGANLLALSLAGLPVPPWLCITTELFAPLAAELAVELAELYAAVDVEDRASLRRASQAAAERVHAIGLPADAAAALDARLDGCFSSGALVAVRSSAVGEDSAKDSFAGQMDTYLYVRRGELVQRVLDCFASAYSERALLYRRLRGFDLRAIEAAVVVQQMIDSRVSGILFTANPTSGDLDEAVVAAGLGLGEGIVGGLVESDTYFCELATGRLREQQVAEKRSRIVFDRARGAGTLEEPVGAEDGDRPALDEAQLTAIVALGRRAQLLGGGLPQDVEWALDPAGTLHLLQTRPITTLGRERESLFDNANIVESYPGLSSPLTFSFARHGYEVTFRENSRMLGTPESILAEHAAVHANLVALLDGRIYYNLLNWYRLFQLVPGFEWALPAWEKALGLPRRYLRRPPPPTARQRLATLRIYGRMVWHFFALERNVARFFDEMRSVTEELARHDLADQDPHRLLDLVELIGRRIMPRYAISVLNDSFGQQLHELLGKVITRLGLGGEPADLRNQLLCGESGMESVEPVRSLLGLAALVRANARLRALLDSDTDPEAVWETLQSDPLLDDFRAQLDRHLDLYGDRTLHELKLETPSAADNPTFLVTMLRNYLHGGQEVEPMEAHERAIRRGAEAEVARRLRWKPLRRALFGWLLRRTRAAVRSRENLRLARTRAFGMAKRVYRVLARRFVERGLLEAPDDLFWLTTDEVAGAVRGHSLHRDLRALVGLRRREYAAFAGARLEGRITTCGMVQAAPLAAPVALDGPAEAPLVLRGLGCSPGRVSAPAKVILDPSVDLTVRGEILVAPMTDPGWVFLMVASRGIVAEKGSLLSHTAIIGRELGIPTVVGVKNATRLIATGRQITLDGTTGNVELADSMES